MQTSFGDPAIGREGGIANTAFRFIMSVVVALAAGLVPGRVYILDASGNAILPLVSPAVDMALDVDAFFTTTATAAAPVVLTTTPWGVIGQTELTVARRGTITLNSHADWNATTAVWVYIDHRGNYITENIAIPDAGNVTLYTQGLIAKHVSLTIPTQGGTGGSFTVGVAAGGASTITTGVAGALMLTTSGAALNYRRMPGLVVYESTKAGDPPDYSNTNRSTHAQYSQFPGMRRGFMFVKPEDTVVAGQDVYVRITATGDEKVGALRGTPDGTDCVLLEGARFFKGAAAAAIAVVEIHLV